MGKDEAGGDCATGAKKLRKEKRPAATGLFEEKMEGWSVNHLCNCSVTLTQFARTEWDKWQNRIL